MKNIFFSFIASVFIFLSASVSFAETPIAKVGERVITMEEVQRILNSTPYAMPDTQITPGAGNNRLMLQIISEIIDSELLYHEALSLNIPQKPEFQREVSLKRKSLLADMYRSQFLSKNIKDDPEGIKRYSKEKGISEKMAKTILQGEERKRLIEREGSRLFDLYQVKYSPLIAKTGKDSLKDDDILVSSSAFKIYFRDVRDALSESGNSGDRLLDLLSQAVEVELFSFQGKKEGLDKSKGFIDGVSEYEKNLAVVAHREQLKKRYLPNDKEIENFIKENDFMRFKPQTANALLIVAKTEKEAVSLRNLAIKGSNFYELAMNNSIAPNAKINAGRIDPIIIGEHPYTSVDKALLGIKPGEITMPIKGDKGYSIFKLIDITRRELKNTGEIKSSAARLILERKMEGHFEKLRKGAKIEFYNAIKETAG